MSCQIPFLNSFRIVRRRARPSVCLASIVILGVAVGSQLASAEATDPLVSLGGYLKGQRQQDLQQGVQGDLDFQSFVLQDSIGVLNSRYQIGSEWGKKPFSEERADEIEDGYHRAALAAARVGGATGFVLGEFGGAIVVATNHHVLPHRCPRGDIRFPLLKISGRCELFLGTWKEVDLSLVTIQLQRRGSDREKLLEQARNFDFDNDLYAGQELVTAGFGVANNPFSRLMVNSDSDCVVLSETNDFRKMPDPDALNPGPDEVWSFANGCDVSHGDSGSAMVDRSTGKVVGIIWTGKIPKESRIQDSEYVQGLLGSGSEEIWTQLSYGAPAAKILPLLEESAQSSESERVREILSAVVAD